MNLRLLVRPDVAAACVLLPLALLSCASQEKVAIAPSEPTPQTAPVRELGPATGKLDPIARYGGYVLTATTMPQDRGSAYYWAKQTGTLVAYETFLRRYSDGGDAQFFREEIRRRFVPQEEEWREAWLLYSRMEVIDGAVCDPDEGLILLGRPGSGRLPPFFYDDLITALRCSLSKEKVGVTMNRIFRARFNQPEDPREPPHEVYETSVDFYSKKLWNTHMAYLLFEGDRMLKTLSHGYDIFLREPVQCHVPGFRSVVEMAATEPPEPGRDTGKYGRVWIELTSVKINTTEKKNVAMFSDVRLEVRAESEHEPPMRFAAHLRTNYTAYGLEFPIFAEVERAARVVAIARWLAETYPEAAERLVEIAYENAQVFVPQVIPARIDITHDTPRYRHWLIGGVHFPNVNRNFIVKDASVAETPLDDLDRKVRDARSGKQPAWEVALGKRNEDRFIAWCVAGMSPGKAAGKRESVPARTAMVSR